MMDPNPNYTNAVRVENSRRLRSSRMLPSRNCRISLKIRKAIIFSFANLS